MKISYTKINRSNKKTMPNWVLGFTPPTPTLGLLLCFLIKLLQDIKI
jgi:hypothetical protein